MPGWHEATKQLEDEGMVKTVGIIQEQHPQRARLFMQWKRMGWPILVDSLNQLGVAVVPITVLVDEHGIVRRVGPRPADLEAFLAAEHEPPPVPLPRPERRPIVELRTRADAGDDAAAWRDYGRALTVWGGPNELDAAIEAFEHALEFDHGHAVTHFQLGAAYRHRYDSEKRREGDFRRAAEHWTAALGLEPNQYIWRRRIQQYGPRLAKPYPFYDWVDTARAEVRERGEEPVELRVEPSGAEIAQPSRSFAVSSSPQGEDQEGDPDGRILRDKRGFIAVEQVVVPAAIAAGAAGRVHLAFRPNEEIAAHWNNEAEDLRLWITPPPGWQVDRRFASVPNPPREVSLETRRVEFELRAPDDAQGVVKVPAYALYYVCEDVDGTCLYRRQDIEVEVRVRG